ncbi:MAG: SPFH domain-containing protein [Chloroflexi bacterium]|nr:SPFH domain-containing protein [Chloroflexota bacterium]
MKRLLPVAIALLAALTSTGCYLNEAVATNEVAAQRDGGRITNCVGPGVYTDLGLFSDLTSVSSNALTLVVGDKEVATKDTQLVGTDITVQFKRKTDCESMKNLLTNWSLLARDDNRLQETVSNITAQAIKVAVRNFTLEELLDDRDSLAQQIRKDLVNETSKFSVDVLSVGVKNVTLDPAYSKILNEKALLTAQIDAEKRRQDLIRQQAANQQLEQDQKVLVLQKQLLAEKARTDVDLEVASRDSRVSATKYQVFAQNPAALELERLRLLKDVLGDKSVIYLVPQNSSLNLILGNLSGTTPVSGTLPIK